MSDSDSKRKMKPSEWDSLDVQVQYTGRHITLPDTPDKMPLVKAKEAIERQIADDAQVFQLHEKIEAFPLDAAVAFVKAMKNLYGWISPRATPGFFGPNPPTIISVKTGPRDEDVVQCPMGGFALPGVDSQVNTLIDHDENVFIIHCKAKKKDKSLLLELANETRRIIREGSIYKGKPIQLKVDDYGQLDLSNPPDFLDVEGVSEDNVMFDDDLWAEIHTSVLVPIKHTDAARKIKIPRKRGVLLAGPFGTGKSLLLRVVAKVSQDHGWTCILLNRVQGLRAGLEFALKYRMFPVVVIAEDVDRIAEERTDAVNELSNVIDGVISKDKEVMTILTTNFPEKIDKVLLRPGRIDDLIKIRAPGPATVQKLLRYYAKGLLEEDAVLEGAGAELAGQIPATIRECVERAKLAMIGRDDNMLADSDFVIAAQTMKNHLALLNGTEEGESTAAEQLAKALREVVGNGEADKLDALQGTTNQIRNLAKEIRSRV